MLETVSGELRREFPGLRGFSVRNLKYMRVFAREWRGNAIGQRLVAQLPWGHNIVLLESVSSVGERLAYALADMKRPAGVSTYQLGLPSPEVLQERLMVELK